MLRFIWKYFYFFIFQFQLQFLFLLLMLLLLLLIYQRIPNTQILTNFSQLRFQGFQCYTMFTHTHTHTYTLTYIHICIYIHSYIRTQRQSQSMLYVYVYEYILKYLTFQNIARYLTTQINRVAKTVVTENVHTHTIKENDIPLKRKHECKQARFYYAMCMLLSHSATLWIVESQLQKFYQICIVCYTLAKISPLLLIQSIVQYLRHLRNF